MCVDPCNLDPADRILAHLQENGNSIPAPVVYSVSGALGDSKAVVR